MRTLNILLREALIAGHYEDSRSLQMCKNNKIKCTDFQGNMSLKQLGQIFATELFDKLIASVS